MKSILTSILMFAILTSPAAFADQGAKTDPKPAATSPSADMTTTAEGTLKLFTKAMKEGDFNKVVELCDPAAEAYNDLTEMAKAFDPSTANPNIQKEQLQIVRDFFTKPWQNVEHKAIAEQGNRAQYRLVFSGIDPKTKEKTEVGTRNIDLNKIDDKWFVLVSADLMKPATPPSAPVAPAEAMPAEKPSDQKPAEAPKKQ